MQSIRSSTRLLQRHRFSISNTLRFTSSSSSSGSWSENESRMVGFDSFPCTRAATYLISSLKNVGFSSSAIPKQDFKYSLRCFSTTGDSVQSTPQGSPESDCVVPQRIKFKRLDKTAKHIMQVQLKLDNYHGYNHVIFYLCHNLLQIVDKEAVEEVRNLREIPEIKPGYIVQLKVEVPENKRRVSIVKGVVIARRNAGLNSTFRIRRLVAGVGVESMFPLYSPNLREIKVVDKKKVRRAKLYYLRDKVNALKKH
ncbi:Ribosomal protein L19 family protein [Arabidopsis thaliana]|uniref:Ribosomal protein L19 family protein n=1 Tax=Arabidopsis thaliana TaxID=3702 RepID=A0A1P8BFU6_ARATH|nr:Ribosomal protein L19 family protein [Arabidopsis thaliana]ANM70483.1 Ribosomal protein L19 family protein [Arabidopsis thaliana]|eukprot:NP_001332090.1 Ribosomal protein L19 family protein [Arabidopsis thaliana]